MPDNRDTSASFRSVLLPGRVRMESPDALFCPDHHIETPVPAPLYLLRCIRLPLESAYPTRDDGSVLNPAHAFQKNEIVYPDGSRFWAEISANPMLGLPSVYDLDYLLGVIRLADQGQVDSSGKLDVTYRSLIQATRAGEASKRKVESAKRALGRWGNTSVRTAMNMVLREAHGGPAGEPAARTPAARPSRLEREATHWILEYDWETEYHGSTTRDTIGTLRINPVWLAQAESGMTAWIDIEIHNAISSPIAKGMYLQLVLAAAEGHRLTTHIAPLQWWIDAIGVTSREKPNKIAARFQEAVQTLIEREVLSAGEVSSPRRGEYEIAIEPGSALTGVIAARGIGSMDPVRTRTLVWHLRRLGCTPSEARTLLSRYGIGIQGMLQRVHYERTVKQGTDAKGQPILQWERWIEKGLRQGWKFEEPEYREWLEAREARFHPRLAAAGGSRPVGEVEQAAIVASTPDPVAVESVPRAVVLPDNIWGQAVGRVRGQVGEQAIRTWLQDTWLTEVTEATVNVGTVNPFAADWIRTKYGSRLEAELREILGRPIRLVVEAESEGRPLP
jgi:hypothetical protein